MMLFKIPVLFLILSCSINFIKCDTILFTNSPNHLVTNNNINNNNINNNNNIISKKNFTSYQLQVPTGSITVIEEKSSDPNENLRSINSVINENTKKTVFAPSLLQKFMNEYNIKVSSKLPESDIFERSKIKRYDNYGQDNSYPETSAFNEKRNPFQSKEGWVTLEAVPWSKSQVAKWKPKGDVRPINTVSSLNIYREGNDDDDTVAYRNKFPGEQMMEEASKINQYPNQRPSFYNDDKLLETNRRRPNPMPPDFWQNGRPIRKKPHNDRPDIEIASDRWYDYGLKEDNVYSNKYPSPSDDNYNLEDDSISINSGYHTSMRRSPLRKPDSNRIENKYSQRPSSHPENGNGEWVLVSTTKGYQHPKPTSSLPRKRKLEQYSMPDEEQEQSPTSYRVHKSIKLTVLPPKDSKLTPMSTSHGGLIEHLKDDTTVEDSVINSFKRKVKRKAVNEVNTHSDDKIEFFRPESNSNVKYFIPFKKNDRSTTEVLAAIGAGMVPATIGMIMPMVLG